MTNILLTPFRSVSTSHLPFEYFSALTVQSVQAAFYSAILEIPALMASKRLQLDEVVSEVKGVMLFLSAVGGVTTNSTNRKADREKNPSKEQDSNSQEKEIAENLENERAEQPERLRNVIKIRSYCLRIARFLVALFDLHAPHSSGDHELLREK